MTELPKEGRFFATIKKYKIIGDKMVTLNIDNPAIENYFHQNADEMLRTLEAIALNKAHLVVTNNAMPQAAAEIWRDIEAYRRGELKTIPYNEGMDEMMQELKLKYANQ